MHLQIPRLKKKLLQAYLCGILIYFRKTSLVHILWHINVQCMHKDDRSSVFLKGKKNA